MGCPYFVKSSMIEYFPIYSGEKGLSVRSKLNKSFYDLTIGPEGVNEVWLRLNNLQYLRVAKSYLTFDDMMADKTNPIREDGYPLREGELVSVTDDVISSNKGFYRRTADGFTFMYAFSATSHTQLLDVRTVGDLNIPENARDLHITKEFSDRVLNLLDNPGPTRIQDLADVSISFGNSGDLLVYDGAMWRNLPQSELIPDFSGYTESDPTVPMHVKAITVQDIENWNTNQHTHYNKGVIDSITESHLEVLSKFSIVGGKLQISIDTYSTGELSAYGLGDGSEPSNGALSTLVDVQLTNPVDGQYLRYNGTHWINTDFPDVVSDWNEITNRPTTLSGYGVSSSDTLFDNKYSLIGHTHTFASLTVKPNTFSGYVIPDVYTNTEVNTSLLAT